MSVRIEIHFVISKLFFVYVFETLSQTVQEPAIFLKTYELYFRLREKYILQISLSIESVLSYYIDILLFDRASIKFVILHPSLSLSLSNLYFGALRNQRVTVEDISKK